MVHYSAHVCTWVVFYFAFIFNKPAHVKFAHVALLMYIFRMW